MHQHFSLEADRSKKYLKREILVLMILFPPITTSISNFILNSQTLLISTLYFYFMSIKVNHDSQSAMKFSKRKSESQNSPSPMTS